MAGIANLKDLGIVTVTTSGTEVKVFGNGPYPKVASLYIRALSTNTGVCFVGTSSVDHSTQAGRALAAGATLILEAGSGSNGGSLLMDVDKLFVDSTVNNDKVFVSYFEVV